jgi:sulfate permease, SulP family
MPGDRRGWLWADLVAGVVAAAVVIPKALAFATIAGLPIAVGLYTALIPPVVYAALGTSRPLSVTTTSTISILVFAALHEAVPGGQPDDLVTATTTLAVLVGAMLAAASLLRLGFVANFISDPVLAGFKSGIGLVIVVGQLPKLLGFHIDSTTFLRDAWSIAAHLPDTSLPTLGLSLAMLALMFALERFAPRSPVPLIAIVLGIAASHWLGLTVSTVGEVPRDLPRLVLPHFDLALGLWPAALGIALMSFTESIAAGRAFADPDEPRLEPNRELLALGVANAAGGLFGAMPAGGGTTQTAVNRLAGARTQAAEVVTGATALAALLLLAPLIALMPNAVLAAVVVVYSITLIKPAEFRAIARVRSTEFWWALIAFGGVVLLGTLQGIIVAVIASLLSLAQQTWNPPVYVVARKRGTQVFRPVSAEHPDDETFQGLLLLRLEGRLYFANAQRFADKVLSLVEEHRPSVLVIDCSALIDIEYTALRMLVEAEPKLRKAGIALRLVALNPAVLDVVQRSPLGESMGREGLLFNLEAAVAQFEKDLRPSH